MPALHAFGKKASVILVLLLLLLLHPGGERADAGTGADALQRRALAELATFTGWLEVNGVRGYVGEVGWPDDAKGDADRWNALADRWYRAADEAGLWVTSWGTGEWWGTEYKLAPYESLDKDDRSVDQTNTQVPVLESHLRGFGYRRGVTVNGGEFGSPISAPSSRFSNVKPGAYNTRYHYDRQGTFDYLASRGMDHVRIPFRWERVQPTLGGPLDRAEVDRIRAVVSRAAGAGVEVVLDMHNYGAYYLHDGERGVRRAIGSSRVPVRYFANVWKRLSNAFRAEANVIGYALMAEPYDMPSAGRLRPAEVWEKASRRAVAAIRKTGDAKLISVAGYGWDAIQVFTKHHPDAWVDDPADNLLYEVHHYWDGDHSGDYSATYDRELERARNQGW